MTKKQNKLITIKTNTMKQKTFETLFNLKLIKNGQFTLKNGERTSYMVSYHKVKEKEVVNQILADLFLKKYYIYFNDSSTHIIGLANSGTSLSLKIYKRLIKNNYDVTLTIINPKKLSLKMFEKANTSHKYYLIDNAITSGKTLNSILPQLKEKGIMPSGCFYIFDREENMPIVLNCEIFPIFTYSDITKLLTKKNKNYV